MAIDADQPAVRARQAVRIALDADHAYMKMGNVDWIATEAAVTDICLGTVSVTQFPTTQEVEDLQRSLEPVIVLEGPVKRRGRAEKDYQVRFPGQSQDDQGKWFSKGDLKRKFPNSWQAMVETWKEEQKKKKENASDGAKQLNEGGATTTSREDGGCDVEVSVMNGYPAHLQHLQYLHTGVQEELQLRQQIQRAPSPSTHHHHPSPVGGGGGDGASIIIFQQQQQQQEDEDMHVIEREIINEEEEIEAEEEEEEEEEEERLSEEKKKKAMPSLVELVNEAAKRNPPKPPHLRAPPPPPVAPQLQSTGMTAVHGDGGRNKPNLVALLYKHNTCAPTITAPLSSPPPAPPSHPYLPSPSPVVAAAVVTAATSPLSGGGGGGGGSHAQKKRRRLVGTGPSRDPIGQRSPEPTSVIELGDGGGGPPTSGKKKEEKKKEEKKKEEKKKGSGTAIGTAAAVIKKKDGSVIDLVSEGDAPPSNPAHHHTAKKLNWQREQQPMETNDDDDGAAVVGVGNARQQAEQRKRAREREENDDEDEDALLDENVDVELYNALSAVEKNAFKRAREWMKPENWATAKITSAVVKSSEINGPFTIYVTISPKDGGSGATNDLQPVTVPSAMLHGKGKDHCMLSLLHYYESKAKDRKAAANAAKAGRGEVRLIEQQQEDEQQLEEEEEEEEEKKKEIEEKVVVEDDEEEEEEEVLQRTEKHVRVNGKAITRAQKAKAEARKRKKKSTAPTRYIV